MAPKALGMQPVTLAARRVVILSGNHLCHNPRAHKEAVTLTQLGYEVQVLGAWIDRELKEKDRALIAGSSFQFIPVVDFTVHRLNRVAASAKSKVGEVRRRVLGTTSAWQLGSSIGALKRMATKTHAKLFVAHSEMGMAVAADLLMMGRKVGIDMEDWFSEDLLPEARKRRPLKLLRDLERTLLKHASHRTCTSHAMAEALAAKYGCSLPAVVYNAFPWSDRENIDGLVKDRRNLRLRSIHWVSQTLGFGRGLEDLVTALPLLQYEAEIHLRGRAMPGFAEWLSAQLPSTWRDRVYIHDLVPNHELLSRIAEHDIGFAGEQKFCKSRDLTVTNKILQYLLGGLAVLASDTAGQREIAQQAQRAVHLYHSGNSQGLAAKLNLLLSSPEELVRAKQSAVAAAEDTFCWEKCARPLTNSVQMALCCTQP